MGGQAQDMSCPRIRMAYELTPGSVFPSAPHVAGEASEQPAACSRQGIYSHPNHCAIISQDVGTHARTPLTDQSDRTSSLGARCLRL